MECGQGQLLATLQGHTGAVGSAEFSRDSQRIVTASEDKTARVFPVVTLSDLADLLAKQFSSGTVSQNGGRALGSHQGKE